MTRARRRTIATLTLAAMATLTACADEDPAEFSSPASTPASSESQEPDGDAQTDQAEPTATAEDTADDAATPGPGSAAPVGPQDAIDTITYEVIDSRGRPATVTLGLHSLQEEGEVMRLELSFTPEFEGDFHLRAFEMIGRKNADYYVRPVLNDRENLKQYTVLEDEEGNQWATPTDLGTPGVASGQTLRYWAYFAAPEDDIDTISVGVDHVEFENVPIERDER